MIIKKEAILDTVVVEFNDEICESDLVALHDEARLVRLQCRSPVRNATWQMLDEVFFSTRPDDLLRVYGYNPCDLGFTSVLRNVRHLSVDFIRYAKNIGAIASIPNLESLTLDISDEKDFDVLNDVSLTLTTLSLGPTRSQKLSLAPIQRFHALRKLSIDGHKKGIEAVGALRELRELRLRCVTTPNLEYIRSLPLLEKLYISLGGIQRFDGLEGKQSIKCLELNWIRNLKNIDVVSSLSGLQFLSLESLPHIAAMPTLDKSVALRRISLENMKGLDNFDSLEGAPALQEFSLVNGRWQVPEQLLPVLRNPVVKRVSGGFGSNRKNIAFFKLCDEFGKSDWWDGGFGAFQIM